ncbi:hypothetical protein KKA24_01395 [Patescibacteria group bacterium]|nr:hypothetical protein [Patescibacteria group bacterium]
MIFKYNKQINKKYWELLLKYKGMFGIKFPDKISITKQDEKMAKQKTIEISDYWNKDKELKENIFKIYKYELPKVLKCYIITTRTSATYLEKKCILLSMQVSSYNFSSPIPTTIIHEFSHIAFLDKYSNMCKKLGYTDNGIQELKEVLTVINNLEYKDINDKGYKIHQELREMVEKMWQANKSLIDIIGTPKTIKVINSLSTIQKIKK